MCETNMSTLQTGRPQSCGVHMCQIYSDDDERNDALLQLLVEGFRLEERAACFSEKIGPHTLASFLADHDLSYTHLSSTGALALSGAREAYFNDDVFDPDRMLASMRIFSNPTFRGKRL